MLFASLALPLGAAEPDVDPFADPPSPALAGQTAAAAPGEQPWEAQVLVDGLQSPRSLLALPDGALLVAEGNGAVRRLSPEGELSAPLPGLPPVRSVNGRGFNDLVLAHDFAQSRLLYLSYAAPPADEAGGPATAEQQQAAQERGEVFQLPHIARARLREDGQGFEDVEVIAELPGRRLLSAPDDSLYITTQGHAHLRPLVQQLDTLEGKVLRIMTDGGIPADNPFHGSSSDRPEIWSWGHRDPDGLALHPLTGALWAVEHGPMGGDELNRIEPGANYGWPLATYGKNYDGTVIGPSSGEGMKEPVYYWYPSIAPSDLLFYTGDLFPQWKGDLFIGALSPSQGRFLIRLVLKDGQVVAEQRLLSDRGRRVRALAQGVDGAIFVLTDSEAGEAQVSGEILKLDLPAAES